MMGDLVNEELSVSLVMSLPRQRVIIIQYIKSIKFFPKLIGIWQDAWHNGEGSGAQV